jgi:NhaP-type Na+/H+ or K+/H+ antiporter
MLVISFILLRGNEMSLDPDTGETMFYPAELLLLASVLASTDTVAVLTLITPEKYEVLNAVLFGEGVVNDAVTILLYKSIEVQMKKANDETDASGNQGHMAINGAQVGGMVGNFFYLSFVSILIGMATGLLTSLVLKHFNMGYDPVKESMLMLIFAYLSYLIAEHLALSGIISMFSCGLFMAHYAFYNISRKAQKGIDMTVNAISGLSQSFIYIYLGLSLFTIKEENVKPQFIALTLGSILVCRVFSVGVPLLLVYLCSGCKPLALSWNQWSFVYAGGLIRGAIAFALSTRISSPHSEILQTTTQICAICTIVGVGGPLQLFAKCFGIKPDKEAKKDAKALEEALLRTDQKIIDVQKVDSCVTNNDDDNRPKTPDASSAASWGMSKMSLKNEEDAMNYIDREFEDLAAENT